MSIAFTCPACGKVYKLKDELAGRTAKCSCGHAMTVPKSVERVAAPVEKQSGGAASTAAVAQAPVAPPRIVDPQPPASDQSARWYDKNAVVIVLLIFFFPVGLYALWKNSHYSKATKGIVTGFVALLLVIGLASQAAAKKGLADANAMWAAGRQGEAVAKYKQLITDNFELIDESGRPQIFQRVIEFELAHGEKSTAQHFVDKAISLGVSLAFTSPEATAMLSGTQNAGSPSAVGSQSGQSKSAPKTEQATAITWDEYVRDCGSEAQNNNEPRAEKAFAEKYKGRTVSWVATIQSIKANMLSGNTVYLTMMPSESRVTGMDVALDMSSDFDVTTLNKGDSFSFIAKITTQGGNMTPHQLEYRGKPQAK